MKCFCSLLRISDDFMHLTVLQAIIVNNEQANRETFEPT